MSELWEPFEVSTAEPCCECGIETTLVDLDFHAYVCSEPCMRLLLAGYWAAENEHRRRIMERAEAGDLF